MANISVAAVLRDFEITMDGKLCANYSRPPAQIGVSQILCEKTPMRSDSVKLKALGRNMRLIICEMEVFAQHKPGMSCTRSHQSSCKKTKPAFC